MNKVKYTEENVPAQYYNTRRHYYGKPSEDYYEKMNNMISNTHINHKLNDERVHLEEEHVVKLKADQQKEKREKSLDKERSIYKSGKQDKETIKTYETEKRGIGGNFKGNTNEINKELEQYYDKNSNLDLAGINEKIRLHAIDLNIDFDAFLTDFFKGKTLTSYDEIKLLLINKFELSENECNRFLSQIVSIPPRIGLSSPNSGFQQWDIRSELDGYQPSNFKTQSDYNNAYDINRDIDDKNNALNTSYRGTEGSFNKNIMIEDFMDLLKRSADFPKAGIFLGKSQDYQNPFERERQLLQSANSSKLNSSFRNNRYEPNVKQPTYQQQSGNSEDILVKMYSCIKQSNINMYQLLSEEDTNNNGTISHSGFFKVVSKLGIRPSKQEIISLLHMLGVKDKENISIRFLTSAILQEADKLMRSAKN